jgi:hypothetical protein
MTFLSSTGPQAPTSRHPQYPPGAAGSRGACSDVVWRTDPCSPCMHRARPSRTPMCGRALPADGGPYSLADPHDELAEVPQTSVRGVALPGDTVVVSEKVAVLLTGRGVPIGSVRPGVLARLLAGSVHPRPRSRGLSAPEKMQYVLERSGRARLLVAAAVSALTRPLGVHGLFYRVAGPWPATWTGAAPRSSICCCRPSTLARPPPCVPGWSPRWARAWRSSTSTTSAAPSARPRGGRCPPRCSAEPWPTTPRAAAPAHPDRHHPRR